MVLNSACQIKYTFELLDQNGSINRRRYTSHLYRCQNATHDFILTRLSPENGNSPNPIQLYLAHPQLRLISARQFLVR